MPTQSTPSEAALLAEYAASNDAYMHYDNFSWQVGAVLIAGTFVFWGFLIDQNIELNLLVVGSILVAILLSVWILYSSHNRQIYLCKLHRLHEIEMRLGLKQHQRWIIKGNERYRTFGPPGHVFDTLTYLVTSLGTPLIGIFKLGFHPWLGLPVLLVLVVLLWTSYNERRLKNHLKQIPGKEVAID